MTIFNPYGEIEDMTISGDLPVGLNFQHVREVIVTSRVTRNLPATICRQFVNLQSILMSSVMLRTLNVDECPNLTSLEILNNLITTIDVDTFANTRILHTINFSSSRISSISAGSFNGLSNSLQNLLIGNNDLSDDSLELGAFDNLNQLQLIDLAMNEISVIDSRVFGSSLNTLVMADFSRNLMFAIDPLWFDNAPQLMSLSMGGNICANQMFNQILMNREQVRSQLERCFEMFETPPTTTTQNPDITTTTPSGHDGSFMTCDYWIFGDDFICRLMIYNPNGRDDFVSIGGEFFML